ncbi:hypothetical protein [Xanthovirga aplysinae]|uniref:hypothetical protein n=1 Tax=Xanthovirga aplysinae TaxID=2529853 RepID=UPI0012BC027B|nr:hypothetical protein [Xanthovirga aplysinae]MTI31083.1 hypothetical protein [Xanthovirga aplysinae]
MSLRIRKGKTRRDSIDGKVNFRDETKDGSIGVESPELTTTSNGASIASSSQGSGQGVNTSPREGLTFSRFLGFGRLTNWFYSSKEEQLISLQKNVKDMLDDFNKIYEGNEDYLAAKKAEELVDIEEKLKQISGLDLSADDYEDVEKQLEDLRMRLDRESVKQEILLGLDSSFAKGSPQELPDKATMVKKMKEFAIKTSINEASEFRYLLDALSQWTSDAVLRIPASASLEPLFTYKKRVAGCAALINEAFFYGTVKRDYNSAMASYQKACGLLLTIDFDVIAGPKDVKPKAREDFKTPFDPGAMMLAAVLNDSDFVPDLLVGLPTGGAHAANKLAGALGVLKGNRPTLWYTRPQAVKESSRALFDGIEDSQKFRKEELAYIREELLRQTQDGHSPKIVIVDDGAVSGKTLEIARQIYYESFKKEFDGLEVRTATIKGGSTVEFENLPKGAKNTIDYVVNQTNDRVGNPKILRGIEPKSSEARTFGLDVGYDSVPLSTRVDIISDSGKARTIRLAETLLP